MANVDNIEYTVYNRDQIVVKNHKRIFGSSSKNVHVQNIEDKSILVVDLTQVHWKAFDLPEDRCTQDKNPNTLQCIKDSVATKSGCQLPPADDHQNGAVICNSYEQFQISSNVSERHEKMDENQIFAETGCLSSCDKMVYDMSVPRSSSINPFVPNNSILLHFLFDNGKYSVKEQYYIYDSDSLIADIGGYMGLLLGQSILGLYHIAAATVARRRSRRGKK